MSIEELKAASTTLLFGETTRQVADLGLLTLSLTLLSSLLSSLVLSWAYSTFYGSRAMGSHVHRAFPLISIAVTAIFICVQFSLPLSLGLLGSLSIVRFRTPIKEPEEIGFLMLVIASALCCASFNVAFLLVILAAAFAALLLLRWSPPFLCRRAGTGTLVLRCNSEDYHRDLSAVSALISKHLHKPAFDSVSTQGSDCVVSWSFQKVTLAASAELEKALLREMPSASLGIYYNNHANG